VVQRESLEDHERIELDRHHTTRFEKQLEVAQQLAVNREGWRQKLEWRGYLIVKKI